MARVAQGYLKLNWEVIEQASDLERLRLLLNSLDDEGLMQELERDRKGRRDEYPVRVCWNCLLAQHLLGHAKVSELLRELRRNPTLRAAVGMDPNKGEGGGADEGRDEPIYDEAVGGEVSAEGGAVGGSVDGADEGASAGFGQACGGGLDGGEDVGAGTGQSVGVERSGGRLGA